MHLKLPSIVVSLSDDYSGDYNTQASTSSFNPLMPLVATQLAWSNKTWKTMSSLRQQQQSPAAAPIARNVYSRGSIDVESGDVNNHKRPYTPGASPREILLAQSNRGQPSPSQSSPHATSHRFMDGYRRRMRQASLNLPSETLLDEDLGFPPVCSPPPEVFCGSLGDNRMRNRSNSDAFPGMLGARRLSSSSSNNGHVNPACGGLLVFFPNSPTSSSSFSHGRHESHTDETAEIAVNWSQTQDETMIDNDDSQLDDVSMKDMDCSGGKNLKRPPDFGASTLNSNSSGHSVAGQQGTFSPRARPLFVDTQMANVESSKRRSPVTQVVDFVRGRNRTYSLQLSSSPMSPQSIAARASASCDTQPANSPGRRQTMSGRIHRTSFTSGGLKSFDSGLDLSSPTINHTALLIKEVSRFFGGF